MYLEKDLVRTAKRENNKKRNYLVVNQLQGKHIPVKPSKAFGMFKALAELLKADYSEEKLLLIGFAETATAIGAAVAEELKTLYMQTTREVVEDVDYLYFSEEHSHATEQKLVKNDIDTICNSIDRIVFIEDEVTTGKTILNIIKILEKQYPQIKKYAVASLLNGMNEESLQKYNEKNIDLYYLVKTNHDMYAEIADKFKVDGKYISSYETMSDIKKDILYFHVHSYLNARRLVHMDKYIESVSVLWEEINKKINFVQYNSVLILGTEEFMFPPLFIAKKVEELGLEVRCHSTTRSPIAVSNEDDYPLHTRYQLKSLYDSDRTTYIYDINTYDCVVIITDAVNNDDQGINSLIDALSLEGNKKINVVRLG